MLPLKGDEIEPWFGTIESRPANQYKDPILIQETVSPVDDLVKYPLPVRSPNFRDGAAEEERYGVVLKRGEGGKSGKCLWKPKASRILGALDKKVCSVCCCYNFFPLQMPIKYPKQNSSQVCN